MYNSEPKHKDQGHEWLEVCEGAQKSVLKVMHFMVNLKMDQRDVNNFLPFDNVITVISLCITPFSPVVIVSKRQREKER